MPKGRRATWLTFGIAVGLLMAALRFQDSWPIGLAAVVFALWFMASLREKPQPPAGETPPTPEP